MQRYDLVVIGSGPGGQRAAIQASKAKKRVAVVEKQTMVGGVCINTGTIPSKTMREAVLHLSGFYDQAFYGSNYSVKENITMNDLNFRVTRVIENEAAVLQDQLKRNNVDLYHGTGMFTDANHIRVENTTGFNELEAEFIVIATGTKPAVNPRVAINGRNIVNSDQILGIPTVPRDFDRRGWRRDWRGVRVHVHDAGRARDYCRKAAAIAGICRCGSGGSAQLSHARPSRHDAADGRSGERGRNAGRKGGGEPREQETNYRRCLLYAVGRQGNIDQLNLSAAGVEAMIAGGSKSIRNTALHRNIFLPWEM